jgi:hypothetical protein
VREWKGIAAYHSCSTDASRGLSVPKPSPRAVTRGARPQLARSYVRRGSEGLRNDAIARRLFIAPGTVKVHLSHTFAELGITTCTELVPPQATFARSTTRRSCSS